MVLSKYLLYLLYDSGPFKNLVRVVLNHSEDFQSEVFYMKKVYQKGIMPINRKMYN